MSYQAFKNNNSKEYLGFCEQKGFIYSVQLNEGRFAVVALNNGQVSTLIQFTAQPYGTDVKNINRRSTIADLLKFNSIL